MKTRFGVIVKFLNTSKGTVVSKNLINNGGLDMLASNYVCNVFKYIQMGTGTNQNARSSGEVTVSQTGTTLSSSSPYFTQEDAVHRRMIVISNGIKNTIVGYVDSQTVVVDKSASFSDLSSIVYSIEETALGVPTEITGVCVNGSEYNNSNVSFSGDILTIVDTRTFDFGEALEDTTRNEFGWGPTNSLGSPVFGRIVKEVSWIQGTSIRIEVSIVRSFDCSISNIESIPITGVTGSATARLMAGNSSFQGTDYRSSVGSDGSTVIGTYAGGSLLEMKSVAGSGRLLLISEDSFDLSFDNINVSATGQESLYPSPSYVNGTYAINYIASFNNTFTSTVWRSICFCTESHKAQYRILFTTNKIYNGTLQSLTLQKSWGRF